MAASLSPSHPHSVNLGKAVLRCMDQRAEACRELAARACTALLRADPDATLALLPYAMPVLEERLRADEVRARVPCVCTCALGSDATTACLTRRPAVSCRPTTPRSPARRSGCCCCSFWPWSCSRQAPPLQRMRLRCGPCSRVRCGTASMKC
jgi:hypothetical protein